MPSLVGLEGVMHVLEAEGPNCQTTRNMVHAPKNHLAAAYVSCRTHLGRSARVLLCNRAGGPKVPCASDVTARTAVMAPIPMLPWANSTPIPLPVPPSLFPFPLPRPRPRWLRGEVLFEAHPAAHLPRDEARGEAPRAPATSARAGGPGLFVVRPPRNDGCDRRWRGASDLGW